jgi:hypothetical protein
MQEFVDDPWRNWRLIAFDLVIYLVCGSLITAFIVEPVSPKMGFLGGATWQGILGGFVTGTERSVLREMVAGKRSGDLTRRKGAGR